MEDFQGKYNGKQIEQLLDKANDIDLTKYALKTDNAPTATKLQAARTIALSGAVTGSVSSDFGSNVTISTTLANFDASKIASGTISIDRLPKAAVANESTNGLMAAADKKTMNRLIGVNTVTTLANLPISKRSITATLSAATTLSVQSGMQIGEELMIRCVPSAAFTQAIPNSGAYVSMSGTSITTTANKPFEINIWCYASGKYSIAVKEQD